MSIPVCPTCGIPADTHPAGQCIDAWVEQIIFKRDPYTPLLHAVSAEVPAYSTDIAAAFEVWRKMVADEYWWELSADGEHCYVSIARPYIYRVKAGPNEESLAICRVSLIGKAGEESNARQHM